MRSAGQGGRSASLAPATTKIRACGVLLDAKNAQVRAHLQPVSGFLLSISVTSGHNGPRGETVLGRPAGSTRAAAGDSSLAVTIEDPASGLWGGAILDLGKVLQGSD